MNYERWREYVIVDMQCWIKPLRLDSWAMWLTWVGDEIPYTTYHRRGNRTFDRIMVERSYRESEFDGIIQHLWDHHEDEFEGFLQEWSEAT